MRFVSTNSSAQTVDLREAVTRCVAADGGMYMPESIPRIPRAFFNNIAEMSMPEIAFVVATSLLGDHIPPAELKTIVDRTFTYDAPLKRLDDNRYVLELFYGPTLTFKDYGARFLALLMQYFDAPSASSNRNVLVATTGNTGAAAANGLFSIDGVSVSVLYPKGALSKAQTAQFAALGGNIHPVEVMGTVEDCKRLVQQAMADRSLTEYRLTGANSINIGRLIPQVTFAMQAYSRLLANGVANADKAVYSLPCGNCSNLVATVIAKRLGLPMGPVVAATNTNDQLRRLAAHPSAIPPQHTAPVHTSASSIDMSYPSGWPRMQYLYRQCPEEMTRDICFAPGVSDAEIASTICDLRSRYAYTIDTHGAVAYAAADRCTPVGTAPVVCFATGHPAKQLDVMTRITGAAIELPVQLTRFMGKHRHAAIIPPTIPALRKHLININS